MRMPEHQSPSSGSGPEVDERLAAIDSPSAMGMPEPWDIDDNCLPDSTRYRPITGRCTLTR